MGISKDADDDRPTDRPETGSRPPHLVSILGWSAGYGVPARVSELHTVPTIVLLRHLTELTFYAGSIMDAQGRMPSTEVLAKKLANAAWHRLCYVLDPLGNDMDLMRSEVGGQVLRYPCLGVGIAKTHGFQRDQGTVVHVALRGDTDAHHITIRFDPSVQETNTIEHLAGEIVVRAMQAFPNALPLAEELPQEIQSIESRRGGFNTS